MTGDSPRPDEPDQDKAIRAEEVYGAAPERTALAWQRSGLGVVVGCFLVFHSAIRLDVAPVGVVAIVLGLLVTGLAVVAFPADRYQRGDPTDSWVLLVTITVAVVALGVLGTTVALLMALSA